MVIKQMYFLCSFHCYLLGKSKLLFAIFWHYCFFHIRHSSFGTQTQTQKLCNASRGKRRYEVYPSWEGPARSLSIHCISLPTHLAQTKLRKLMTRRYITHMKADQTFKVSTLTYTVLVVNKFCLYLRMVDK